MGRRLGQHFLINQAIAKQIVDAADIQPTETVLEIGPGKGMLTQFLIEKAKKVITIEKDKQLVDFLQKKFKEAKNLTILHDDALKMLDSKYLDSKYLVVANLPYYITSHFLRLFLEEISNKPQSMTLMVQKEVAERICAKPPHMNLLGLSVQAFGKPKILFKVGKGSFSPPPEVESAVIQISDISEDFFKKHHITPQDFFKLPKKSFSQKRKMLRSSIPEAKLPELNFRKRPQELGLEEWIQIVEHET